MSKKHKKRTKRYSGEDAKRPNEPAQETVVRRYEAVERSKLGEWWQPRKKLARVVAIVLGVLGGGIWLLVELIGIVF